MRPAGGRDPPRGRLVAGPAGALVARIALAVVPCDQLIRDQPQHDPVRLLERPPQPRPALGFAVANGDPLQPALAILGPHLRDSSGEDSAIRTILGSDAHGDGGS